MIYSFEFDDSHRSFMDAASILENHGFRGTFNISLRGVVAERKDDRARMFPPADTLTWDEVKNLQDRGHSIASHGVRHNDLMFATPVELDVELIESKKIFNARGINVETYACAFNNYTQKADAVAIKHYKAIRGTQGMNQLPFKGHVYRSILGTESVDKISSLISKDIWLVGAWHDINPIAFKDSVRRVAESLVPVKKISEVIK